MKIGMTELLLVFIVALFVIGPDKLPYYAKKLGEALGQFKKYSDEAARDIKESIVEPLKEAQEPLKEAMEPLEELDRAVRGNVKDVKDSLNGLGKEAKSGAAKDSAGGKSAGAPEAEATEPPAEDADPGDAAPEGGEKTENSSEGLKNISEAAQLQEAERRRKEESA